MAMAETRMTLRGRMADPFDCNASLR
jgi:hypothetical protein